MTPVWRARMKRQRTMFRELAGLANAVFWSAGLLATALYIWFLIFRAIDLTVGG